jgi:hypothetical protein
MPLVSPVLSLPANIQPTRDSASRSGVKLPAVWLYNFVYQACLCPPTAVVKSETFRYFVAVTGLPGLMVMKPTR